MIPAKLPLQTIRSFKTAPCPLTSWIIVSNPLSPQVMEFPEGYSVLRDHVINQGPLSGEALVRLTKQLANAINTCVINGVDHRLVF